MRTFSLANFPIPTDERIYIESLNRRAQALLWQLKRKERENNQWKFSACMRPSAIILEQKYFHT